MHVLVHSSFRALRTTFNAESPQLIIADLQSLLTKNGSLIMPAFTYCYKRKTGEFEIFNPLKSKSKVGALTESFRQSDKVVRTASATHSFSLWGKITNEISAENAPQSPLGTGSVLDWLAENKDTFVLLLGVDFHSLSFGHYLENIIPLPWVEKNPWEYMDVEPTGVSINGEQKLIQIPGCSKSFINLEKFFLENKIISPVKYKNLRGYFIKTDLLTDHGIQYFKTFPLNVLCSVGTCKACDIRHGWYLEKLTSDIIKDKKKQ